ncbi:DUF58 domain-containing protein [Halomarina halobia]|uniref:DUF58 domain-containing protein n=1 Tax=Halomarina halobia TaxID=3033386 RepID=A0ABD6A559_9EURY|nr:DUF58 domain-containing protein [Halomarina sp. PSR21]
MTAATEHPRFRGALAGALFLAGVGFATASPPIVLAAVIPLAFVLYDTAVGVPDGTVALSRSFDAAEAAPGDLVTVTLAVEHVGRRPLPDVRVVDGVPDGLAVAEGSPRGGLSLRPGDRTTIEYAVRARTGAFTFGPATVRLRSVSAGTRVTDSVAVSGDAALRLDPRAAAVPLDPRTRSLAGSLTGRATGDGTDFHSARAYRPGDPLSRIDWRHFARHGELATLEFDEPRATRVVLVVDDRAAGRAIASPGGPSGVERCVHAAARIAATVRRSDARLGLAVISPPDAGGVAWVPPSSGRGAAATIDAALAAIPDGEPSDAAGVVSLSAGPASTDPSVGERVDRLARHLPSDARVIAVSPLLDDGATTLCERLHRHGHPTTVVSPDVVSGTSPGRRVARHRRTLRVGALRARGCTVVVWPAAGSLELAFATASSSARTA